MQAMKDVQEPPVMHPQMHDHQHQNQMLHHQNQMADQQNQMLDHQMPPPNPQYTYSGGMQYERLH